MKLNHAVITFVLVISIFLFFSCTVSKKPLRIPPLSKFDKIQSIKSTDCSKQLRLLSETKALFSRKQYKNALDCVSEVLKKPCTNEIYIKSIEIIADIFLEIDERINAFYFYSEAVKNSKDSQQRSNIINKMVSITSQMEPEDIFSLLAEIQPSRLQGTILYQTGLKKFQDGNDTFAIKLFNRFIEKFKSSHHIANARALIKTIQQRNVFSLKRIGVLLPLSGFYKIAGQNALDAIKLAVNKVNKSNPKNPFRLFVKDTESDPNLVAQKIKALNKANVACIIGPMVTASQAAAESNRLKLPMITMSQKPGVPQVGEYIFRNYFTPLMQIESGLKYFVENYGFTNFAILYPNEKYGRIYQKNFLLLASEYGCNVTDQVYYTPGQTDFSTQIKKMIHGYEKLNKKGQFVDISLNEKRLRTKKYKAKVDFDVLFIPDSPDNIAMIAPQLRFHDIDQIMLMGTNLWNSYKLLTKANKYIQQSVFPDGFYLEARSKKNHNFISSFQFFYERKPGYIEAQAYNTALMVIHALSLPYVESKADLKSKLHTLTFTDGVSCPVSFKKSGEVKNNLYLFTFNGDKISLIKSCEY